MPEAPGAVLAAVHAVLGRSDAGLVLAQLDDLLGEPESVNLPGTSTERPNWQRLTKATLEQIVDRSKACAKPWRRFKSNEGGSPPDSSTAWRPAAETVTGGQPARLPPTSTCSTKAATFASTTSSVPTR